MKQRLKEIMQKYSGKSNAVSAYTLNQELGLPVSSSLPAVRKLVRELITDGICIGSCNKGFYLITNHAEVVEAINVLRKRRDALNKRIMELTSNEFHLDLRGIALAELKQERYIGAVKAVYDASGMGLKEAKQFVDNLRTEMPVTSIHND